jgi:CRP-like cAMP-binding protein
VFGLEMSNRSGRPEKGKIVLHPKIRKERNMVEISELKQLEALRALSEKQLEKLATITEKKAYKTNTHIYEHGDRAKHLYAVNQGLITLRELSPDDPVGTSFEMRERGELFGAASLMESQTYTLTAVCLKDSEVFAIDADKLLELCGNEPQLGYELMRKVADLYFTRYKMAKRQIRETAKAATIIAAG